MAEGTYLLFIPRLTGYELAEHAGDPPPVGAEVDLPENGDLRWTVSKVGPSPLPGDSRLCAYLLPR